MSTLIYSCPTFQWGIEECDPTSSYHFPKDIKSIGAAGAPDGSASETEAEPWLAWESCFDELDL